MVEHSVRDAGAAGSSPVFPTIFPRCASLTHNIEHKKENDKGVQSLFYIVMFFCDDADNKESAFP